jgi:hypothetical protein
MVADGPDWTQNSGAFVYTTGINTRQLLCALRVRNAVVWIFDALAILTNISDRTFNQNTFINAFSIICTCLC